MNNYLLLADRDLNILEFQETALRYFYGGDILKARNVKEVLKVLERFNKPEILITDLDMLLEPELSSHLETNKVYVPTIACSNFQEDYSHIQRVPMAISLLKKPVDIEAIISLVKGMTLAPFIAPDHVPVSIQTGLKFVNGHFNFFLRLSGTTYIKILNKGDHLSSDEVDKLLEKGFEEIYVRASETAELLKIWEKNLLSKSVFLGKTNYESTIFCGGDTRRRLL